MRQIIPTKDEQFGRAFFVGIADKRGNKGRTYWDMRCQCGTLFTSPGASIRRGHTQSWATIYLTTP